MAVAPEIWDLIVVGGGPAGCTLATLAKKYAPNRRILLLDRSEGPRHHVGESLLPGLLPVLRELGVFEKIDAAGFPRKLGATYVWGLGRKPWDNDFTGESIRSILDRFGSLPDSLPYAWQVRRSRYDQILIEHAAENGVEVRRGVRALAPIEEGDRILGVRVRAGDGSAALHCGLLADCSGQEGFLSRHRRIRAYNPDLKNVAAFGYFKGAAWRDRYTGHPDKTRIFVCSTRRGWFWYIPIDKDVVSVGLVTAADQVKREGIKDLRAMYLEELGRCRELQSLLRGARLIPDFDGSGKDFFTHSDWSYLNVSAAGPGWLAAGDAAVFVDPILSAGVMLAHVGGHRAAYTVLSHWAESAPPMRELLWRDYNAFCREAAAAHLAMALHWYGNDRNARSWRARAGRLQRALLPVRVSDRKAFILLTAGLAQRFDAPQAVEGARGDPGILDEVACLDREYSGLFGRAAAPAREPEPLPVPGGVPKLLAPYRVEVSFLPVAGGRLRPVQRVHFLGHDPADATRDAFNPRRFVVRHHLDLLEAMDGRRSLPEIERLVARAACRTGGCAGRAPASCASSACSGSWAGKPAGPAGRRSRPALRGAAEAGIQPSAYSEKTSASNTSISVLGSFQQSRGSPAFCAQSSSKNRVLSGISSQTCGKNTPDRSPWLTVTPCPLFTSL